jgi:hypothetical protein
LQFQQVFDVRKHYVWIDSSTRAGRFLGWLDAAGSVFALPDL